MKVALFFPTLAGGGVERMMLNLAQGFLKEGLQVDVVLVRAEGPLKPPQGVNVIDLNVPRSLGKLSTLGSLPRLVSYLRQQQPQAMISASDDSVTLWAKLLLGRSLRTRLILTIHTPVSLEVKLFHPRVAGWFVPFFIRTFYPLADAVVAVSRGVAEDFARYTGFPREKIRVIYNPVITPELLAKAQEPVEHPWFQEGEPPVILSVGRLSPPKDFPTLIQAFALVREKIQARLVILGEGEERPRLEALTRELGIEKDVEMPGFVSNPYKYMRRARVFVLSSRFEGLVSVLAEALAIGVPVISTDCENGPREILEGGKRGILVPVGNPQALAEAITEVLASPRPTQGCIVPGTTLDEAVRNYLKLIKS